MQTRLPNSGIWLTIDKYEGTYDPVAHVKAYFTQANLVLDDQQTHYRLFPTTLKGTTLE